MEPTKQGEMKQKSHEPVMLREVLETLGLKPGDAVVDATLGLGGHARAFAEAIRPGGTLIGLDRNLDMLSEAMRRLDDAADIQKHYIHSDYRQIAKWVRGLGLAPNGILMDLGLNSAQVDDPDRGISFSATGPLDMRQDRTRGEPAAALLNRLSPREIENILFRNGDERWAKQISRKIVEIRKTSPLRTTTDLRDAVLAAVPAAARDKRIHPATRTFMAVRIAVNKELEGLDEAIIDAANCLADRGTLAVLYYHSGEGRQTKSAFKELCSTSEFEDLSRKPSQPTLAEVARNPRSRSARLRAIRRVLS